MEKQSAVPLSLYLHWGPGSHAAIERKTFGDSLPVHWWDQPAVGEGVSHPYERLVEFAFEELKTLSDTSPSGRTAILAHSFGAQIAIDLAERAPERIESLTILASNEFTPRAFRGLARRIVSEGGEARPGLVTALQAAEGGLTAATLWPLIQEIASVPDFLLRYWAKGSVEARDRYFEVAASCAPFDFGTFTAVMGGYLEARAKRREIDASAFTGPVRFLAGTEDPLCAEREEFPHWKKRFPQLARAETLPCGHFIQFEASPAFWLP